MCLLAVMFTSNSTFFAFVFLLSVSFVANGFSTQFGESAFYNVNQGRGRKRRIGFVNSISIGNSKFLNENRTHLSSLGNPADTGICFDVTNAYAINEDERVRKRFTTNHNSKIRRLFSISETIQQDGNEDTNSEIKEQNGQDLNCHEEQQRIPTPFFIRDAVISDLGSVSTILTDGFFSDSTNIFTYQIEKLKTYLSLEACFPRQPEIHKYLVACSKQQQKQRNNKNEKVIGFIEIDCRPTSNPNFRRPYMCNLCIDPKWQRQGIATALIDSCEKLAFRCDRLEASELWLKVRKGNSVAIGMYEKLGYDIDSSEVIVLEEKNKSKNINNKGQNGTILLWMKKENSSR